MTTGRVWGRASKWMLSAVALACVIAIAVGTSATAQQGSSSSTATGVTDSEIHIAVLATIDNPFAPGLATPAVNGMKAWARYVNARGGVAGRKIVLDVTDVGAGGDEFRNGIIKACQNDLAMVGTFVILDNNANELEKCNMPDLPVGTIFNEHRDAPTVFFTTSLSAGFARYFEKHIKGCCKMFSIYGADLPSVKDTNELFFTRFKQEGVEIGRTIPVTTTETNYAPFLLAARQDNDTWAFPLVDYKGAIRVAREAKLQNVTSIKAFTCIASCYDENFIKEGGSLVEGWWLPLSSLPFEDKNVPAMRTFLNAYKKVTSDRPAVYALWAWMSGLLFQEAVKRVGSEPLTREAILKALAGIHNYDADGLTKDQDVGGKRGTKCYMLVRVKNGKFQRAYPKSGFDCDPKNRPALLFKNGE
jgi:ABC-type branched-subunit amino acid transport system substrate-binding protein